MTRLPKVRCLHCDCRFLSEFYDNFLSPNPLASPELSNIKKVYLKLSDFHFTDHGPCRCLEVLAEADNLKVVHFTFKHRLEDAWVLARHLNDLTRMFYHIDEVKITYSAREFPSIRGTKTIDGKRFNQLVSLSRDRSTFSEAMTELTDILGLLTVLCLQGMNMIGPTEQSRQ